MKLLAVLAWVLLVAWGAAKLWGWAWDSLTGSEEGWRAVPVPPRDVTRAELEYWEKKFDEYWGQEW